MPLSIQNGPLLMHWAQRAQLPLIPRPKTLVEPNLSLGSFIILISPLANILFFLPPRVLFITGSNVLAATQVDCIITDRTNSSLSLGQFASYGQASLGDVCWYRSQCGEHRLQRCSLPSPVANSANEWWRLLLRKWRYPTTGKPRRPEGHGAVHFLDICKYHKIASTTIETMRTTPTTSFYFLLLPVHHHDQKLQIIFVALSKWYVIMVVELNLPEGKVQIVVAWIKFINARHSGEALRDSQL